MVLGPRLGYLFLYQNQWDFFVSHSSGHILVYAHTIWLYGQILIAYSIPSGTLFPISRIYSKTLFVLVCYIRLLCEKSFFFFSLSPLNLHFLFCYVLSILALILLVLMALFCPAIRRHSFSYYYYYFTHCKFFTPVLSSGFLRKSERRQIFSAFQNSSKIFNQSQLIRTISIPPNISSLGSRGRF